jgi:hypothetical protein
LTAAHCQSAGQPIAEVVLGEHNFVPFSSGLNGRLRSTPAKTKVNDFYLSGDQSGPKVSHEMMTRHNVAYGFVERQNRELTSLANLSSLASLGNLASVG